MSATGSGLSRLPHSAQISPQDDTFRTLTAAAATTTTTAGTTTTTAGTTTTAAGTTTTAAGTTTTAASLSYHYQSSSAAVSCYHLWPFPPNIRYVFGDVAYSVWWEREREGGGERQTDRQTDRERVTDINSTSTLFKRTNQIVLTIFLLIFYSCLSLFTAKFRVSDLLWVKLITTCPYSRAHDRCRCEGLAKRHIHLGNEQSTGI